MGSDGGPSGDSEVCWRIARQHATKGIFITTSDFSKRANDYVSKIGSKIVLIDGSRLAELMIEFGVAVATDATYTVERIDNDFFESIWIRLAAVHPSSAVAPALRSNSKSPRSTAVPELTTIAMDRESRSAKRRAGFDLVRPKFCRKGGGSDDDGGQTQFSRHHSSNVAR